MNLRRRMVAGATVVVLTVAACGGESDETTVAQAIADDLRSEDAFSADITAEEARCVGDEVVATLGADDARSIGRADATDDDDDDGDAFELTTLDDDEIEAIGGSMDQCVERLEAIVVELVADGILETPDDDFPVSEEEARCVGASVASELAFSRLLAIGLESNGDFGDLSDEEATVFGASFSSCVDVRSILLDQVASSGAEPDVVACLDDQISDEAIEMLFVDTFAGDTASAEGAFAEAIDACA